MSNNPLALADHHWLDNLLHLDGYLKQTEADWDSLHSLCFLAFREDIKGASSMINVIIAEIRIFF